MDDYVLKEFTELKTARDFFAIAAANAALDYVDRLDIGLKREACELRLNKLKEMLKNYRMANQAYYDWLRKHK